MRPMGFDEHDASFTMAFSPSLCVCTYELIFHDDWRERSIRKGTGVASLSGRVVNLTTEHFSRG